MPDILAIMNPHETSVRQTPTGGTAIKQQHHSHFQITAKPNGETGGYRLYSDTRRLARFIWRREEFDLVHFRSTNRFKLYYE